MPGLVNVVSSVDVLLGCVLGGGTRYLESGVVKLNDDWSVNQSINQLRFPEGVMCVSHCLPAAVIEVY